MELEAEIWCPGCHSMYGKIYRKQVSELIWENVVEPVNAPRYCGICDRPTERKPL